MDNPVASLVLGSDLQVRGANSAWRRLGLVGLGQVKGKSLEELIPGNDFRDAALNVLSSGEPVEGMVIAFGGAGRERYFSAAIRPQYEIGATPAAVVVELAEFECQIVVEGEAGEIVEINPSAAEALGGPAGGFIGKPIRQVDPFGSVRMAESLARASESPRSYYLGRFHVTGEGGKRIELEGALAPLDARTGEG